METVNTLKTAGEIIRKGVGQKENFDVEGCDRKSWARKRKSKEKCERRKERERNREKEILRKRERLREWEERKERTQVSEGKLQNGRLLKEENENRKREKSEWKKIKKKKKDKIPGVEEIERKKIESIERTSLSLRAFMYISAFVCMGGIAGI